MRQEYRDQLRKLRENMEKAEVFAQRCPLFADTILKEIYTGEEQWITYIKNYKSVRTYNGVTRGHFSSDTNTYVNNLGKSHDVYLWTLYINTLVEYNSHAKYGLNEIHETTPVFCYDNMNSTFYCRDEQIEGLLEALDAWKINAVKQHKIDSIDDDIRKAEEELAEAQAKLAKLKE